MSALVSDEVKKLRNVVETIDSLSQDGFSAISMIADLALNFLATPEGYDNLDQIATALTFIRSKAQDIQNFINYEAETVGCNYVDEDQRKRMAAHLANKQNQ